VTATVPAGARRARSPSERLADSRPVPEFSRSCPRLSDSAVEIRDTSQRASLGPKASFRLCAIGATTAW
jgi:hypothetical protein